MINNRINSDLLSKELLYTMRHKTEDTNDLSDSFNSQKSPSKTPPRICGKFIQFPSKTSKSATSVGKIVSRVGKLVEIQLYEKPKNFPNKDELKDIYNKYELIKTDKRTREELTSDHIIVEVLEFKDYLVKNLQKTLEDSSIIKHDLPMFYYRLDYSYKEHKFLNSIEEEKFKYKCCDNIIQPGQKYYLCDCGGVYHPDCLVKNKNFVCAACKSNFLKGKYKDDILDMIDNEDSSNGQIIDINTDMKNLHRRKSEQFLEKMELEEKDNIIISINENDDIIDKAQIIDLKPKISTKVSPFKLTKEPEKVKKEQKSSESDSSSRLLGNKRKNPLSFKKEETQQNKYEQVKEERKTIFIQNPQVTKEHQTNMARNEVRIIINDSLQKGLKLFQNLTQEEINKFYQKHVENKGFKKEEIQKIENSIAFYSNKENKDSNNKLSSLANQIEQHLFSLNKNEKLSSYKKKVYSYFKADSGFLNKPENVEQLYKIILNILKPQDIINLASNEKDSNILEKYEVFTKELESISLKKPAYRAEYTKGNMLTVGEFDATLSRSDLYGTNNFDFNAEDKAMMKKQKLMKQYKNMSEETADFIVDLENGFDPEDVIKKFKSDVEKNFGENRINKFKNDREKELKNMKNIDKDKLIL